MRYWLMKSEPDVYGIDHLRAEKRKTDHWDGIRNYQARNFIRDEMNKRDLAFFYHSNCAGTCGCGCDGDCQRCLPRPHSVSSR
ncbi:MAG: hypothetical protein Ct9H300mP16_15590 [Pseudomonadota bacterium]|nr:MAG: hypothetical protein Ct9H300mP16_15590 [Pseudomonadota bacterium]